MSQYLPYIDPADLPPHLRLPSSVAPLDVTQGNGITFLRAVQDHTIFHAQHFGCSAYLIRRKLYEYDQPDHIPYFHNEPRLENPPQLHDFLAEVRLDGEEIAYDYSGAPRQKLWTYWSTEEAQGAYKIALERFNNVAVSEYKSRLYAFERKKEKEDSHDTNLHCLILRHSRLATL